MDDLIKKIEGLPRAADKLVWMNRRGVIRNDSRSDGTIIDVADLKNLATKLTEAEAALRDARSVLLQWRCSSCGGNAQRPECSICLAHKFNGPMAEHDCDEAGTWLCPGCDGSGLNDLARKWMDENGEEK